MAQSKFNDLAGKFGKGGPPGLSAGLKVLATLGAAAYGVSQSLFTGKKWIGGCAWWNDCVTHVCRWIGIRGKWTIYSILIFESWFNLVDSGDQVLSCLKKQIMMKESWLWWFE